MTGPAWRDLRGIETARVYRAATEAHAAARLAGSLGKALAEPKDDFGHVSLGWVEKTGELWGAPSVAEGIRAGLSLSPLALLVGDGPSAPGERLDLASYSPEQAHTWLVSAVRARAGTQAADRLEMPTTQRVGRSDSTVFLTDDEALAALGAWFSNAHALLTAVAADIPEASGVRCWPHHFDISTLITLDPDADPEVARSVGIGLSPGDEGHPEPYVYMLPWPSPGSGTELEPFRGAGEWVTGEWFGARLSGSALVGAGDAAAQRAAMFDFVRFAVTEAYRLFGVEGARLHLANALT